MGGLVVFEPREAAAFIVAVGSSGEAQLVRLASDLLVHFDFRKRGGVVSSAKRGALVAVASFRIWHLLLLSVEGVLAKSRVVLHDLEALRRVALVLRCRVIVLPVLRADHSDDFSGFRLFCHRVNLVPASRAGQPYDYERVAPPIARAESHERLG